MKFAIYGGAFLGSVIGGYVPTLWHADLVSTWGIFGGFIGTFAGLWAGYRLGKHFDL